MIGKLEESCLLAMKVAGSKVLASRVHEVLENRTGKSFRFSAIYTTLDRMVDKCWVEVETSSAPEGGRKRRYFRISAKGNEVLNDSLKMTRHLIQAKMNLANIEKKGFI